MNEALQAHHKSEHTRHISPAIWWALGSFSALTLSPYLLPLVGIGQPDSAEGIMHLIGASPTGNPLGTGLAATVQQGIASLPGIGAALTSTSAVTVPFLGTIAAGAIASIAATAVIGIGGVLAANWLEKRESGNGVRWSRVLRYGALATSALIALPGMLSAISIGITFLAAQLGPAGTATHTALALQGFTGATTMHASAGALNGVAAILPHLFTCGLAALPIVGALFMDHKTRSTDMPQQPDTRVRDAQLFQKMQQDYQRMALHA